MTRVYVRTHVGLMDDEDYAALSVTAKAAWHTINMLQGHQTEERFKGRQQIAMLLSRDGFEDPAAIIQELERNRWIVDEGDAVVLKGWHKWQAAKRADYMRDYRAARNGNEQARNGNDPPGEPDSVDGSRNSNVRARAVTSHIPSHTITSRTVPSPGEGAGPGLVEARQVLASVMEGIKRG